MSMLRLDESLFDDDFSVDSDAAIHVFNSGDFDNYKDQYDDSIFRYEPIAGADALADNNGDAIPEGPQAGLDSGIADALISLINDEWEAIKGYNTFRDMILTMKKEEDVDYSSFINVIDEIANEENLHVGQLQELLKQVSPNTESINKGEEEGREQLENSDHEWINGRLKVESHAMPMTQENEYTNDIDTTCSICDSDDEW